MERGSVISEGPFQLAALRHARLTLVRTVQSVTPIALIIALNGASGMPAHRERSEMARRLRAGAYVAKLLINQVRRARGLEALDETMEWSNSAIDKSEAQFVGLVQGLNQSGLMKGQETLGMDQLCKIIETLDVLAAQCLALNREKAV